MLAVIQLSGTQHLIKENDILKVNKLDCQVGDTITIKEVLSTINEGDITIGDPFLKNVSIKAQVLSQEKDKKILIFKKKRRKHHKRKNGHRQEITVLKILNIK